MMAIIIMKKILLLQVNVIIISTFFTFFIVYVNTYSDGNKHIDTGGGGGDSKIPSNHHHQQFPHDNDADDNEQNFSKSKYQPSNQRISYRQSNSNSTILTTKDHIREFSCGHLYYRTIYIDPRRELLYVGAMDNIFRLNLNNINRTHCEFDSIKLNPQSISSCIAKGKSELYDCRNHIRVIQPIGTNHDRFYVCGTNAHNPKDWIINSNLTISNEPLPGIGSGIAKCPFDPEDNSTAIWVENGNPGNLPGLYSGSVAEFTKADTVIFRTDLYNSTTMQRIYPFKRTIKYDSKWLDKPNFVGSFDIGDYVYFFFRESAVEYINCGKAIYSRVARVCKRDTGGKNILNKNWASFLKARLNCSIPGEFPFYFNEIQSVYKYPNDDRKFYAVFSTSTTNGLIGSAICTFSLNKIEEVFLGKFKEQSTSSSAWLPVLSSKVPEPRPGTCVNDTQVLPDSVLNFIRGHPLMDSAVEHDNGRPIFYKRDLIFTRIVIDRLEVDGLQYTVYFAATYTGLVYKIIEWYDQSGQVHTNLVDIIEATNGEPIRAIEISSRHKSLYVASDSGIKQIDLFWCKNHYESCTRCIQDPYCGWDPDQNECKPYTIGLMQDIMNVTAGICDNTIEHKLMKVNWGQSIHLACQIHSPDIESIIKTKGPLKWLYYRSDKSSGFEVYPKRDKYIHTSDNGLVILGVTDRESGRYDCRLGSNTLFSYTINVDAKTCSAPNESEFRKIYSDWCHEFEKYKTAMKNWQIKQSKCLVKQQSHLKK
ncbi:semaphorin 2a isoform X2 [Dermatophagoides pteronyssinus]|uniref:semaphorin 2a isoform X2 n=1 Tax=Dermatophagoides pteronyssinus TaxID=6956 RepID=UPI003F663C58